MAHAYDVPYTVLYLTASRQFSLALPESLWGISDQNRSLRTEEFTARVSVEEKEKLHSYLAYLRFLDDAQTAIRPPGKVGT